jgi:leucyl-tRNA synthetase
MLTPDGSGSPIDGAEHRIDYDTPIPVEDSELPLTLPEMSDFKPGDDPAGCLARAKDWRYFQREDQDGMLQWYARETNTMPQWAGSCWYYLRFADPKNADALLSAEAATWLPVDLYVGGQEHAVLHLLYARFWHRVLYDLGVVDHPEPFANLVHQGMILGMDGEKMSKSRGNVINPDDVVQEHGADVLRMYEMFMGPLEATKPWQTSQLAGIVRFRDRAFSLLEQQGAGKSRAEGGLRTAMHKTIKGVTDDIDRMAFNTAISKLMIYTNELKDVKGTVPRETLETLALLLSPMAPHVAEEMWERLGHTEKEGCIARQSWPAYDEQYCVEDTATVAIQVGGKVRGKAEVAKDLSEEDMLSLALDMPLVSKWVDGKPVKKVIYVPGKILNIVC